MTSSGATAYIAILFVLGLAMAVFGFVLPLGGGTTIMVIGAAAIGAGLVLVGIRMMRNERQLLTPRLARSRRGRRSSEGQRTDAGPRRASGRIDSVKPSGRLPPLVTRRVRSARILT